MKIGFPVCRWSVMPSPTYAFMDASIHRGNLNKILCRISSEALENPYGIARNSEECFDWLCVSGISNAWNSAYSLLLKWDKYKDRRDPMLMYAINYSNHILGQLCIYIPREINNRMLKNLQATSLRTNFIHNLNEA